MSSADVLIIYLAAGTPFGVYSLLDLHGRFGARSLFILGLKYIVWPFFAGLGIYHFVTGSKLDSQVVATMSRERLIANLRSQLSISSFDSQRNDMRELLSAFDTYTGLAEIAAYPNGNRAVQAPALLEPVEHPAPLIAARCIERRNRELLVTHCDRAEHDLRAVAMRFEKKFGNETHVTRLVDDAVGLFGSSSSANDSQLHVYSEDGILSTA